MQQPQSTPRQNPIVLNHFYLVVGKDVIDEIIQSDFITAEFANVEVKTIESADRGSWTGVYIRGESTYIELFDQFQDKPLGSMGIGFGTDMPNVIDSLLPQTQRDFSDLRIRELCLAEDHNHLFQYIEFPSFGDGLLNSFFLQYTCETFKTKKYADKTKYKKFPESDVSRKKYNTDDVDPSKLFKDIVAVEIFMQADLIEKFNRVLNALNDKEQCHQTIEPTLALYPSSNGLQVNIHTAFYRKNIHKQTVNLGRNANLSVEPQRGLFSFEFP